MHLSGLTNGWSGISSYFTCSYVNKQVDLGHFATPNKNASGVCLLSVQMVGLNKYWVASIVVNPFAMLNIHASFCILVIWELNVGFVEVTSALQTVQQRRTTGLSTIENLKTENEHWLRAPLGIILISFNKFKIGKMFAKMILFLTAHKVTSNWNESSFEFML